MIACSFNVALLTKMVSTVLLLATISTIGLGILLISVSTTSLFRLYNHSLLCSPVS
jgi:hypothetical protein